MIQSITLRGLLSYGWEPVPLELLPLNLLIGTNGCGKTNFLDCLDVLRSAPGEVLRPLHNKGGTADWLHKGEGGDGLASYIEATLVASAEATLVAPPDSTVDASAEVASVAPKPLRYRVELAFLDSASPTVSDNLETGASDAPFIFLSRSDDTATVRLFHEGAPQRDATFGSYRWQRLQGIQPHLTTLATLRGNPNCPQITQVADLLEGIYLMQGWTFGPSAPARKPRRLDDPSRTPLDSGYNLGPVLHHLKKKSGETWVRLLEMLRRLYPGLDGVETEEAGDDVRFFLREKGLGPLVPQSRISDGTLRWLTLLALLLDPQPPPLICLEEPELGLHPDMIGPLSELLRDASRRTQIILTTHSDALVSAFSETPEDVVVCERGQAGTTMRRLNRDDLTAWLEEYSLGSAWLRGAFGGTRW